MKDLKILFVFALAIFSSCDLDEDPPYLDKAAFNNPQSVLGTLDGIYAGLASYDGQERRLFVLNGFSGFFNTRRQGGNINNPNNTYLFSLKPNENDNDATQLWLGYYRTIARANTLIANVELNSDSDDLDSQLFEDVVGQAHFVRAWCYFSLTRLFGDVPLLLDLPNNENLMNELNLNLLSGDNLEGDDVIAILHEQLVNNEKIIITNDNDYIQLIDKKTKIVNMQFKDIVYRLEI